MPQLQTKYFGEIEYGEEAVFRFPAGLPGFESEHAFLFLEQPETKPLIFMQSVATAGLCFLMLPVLVADPHYRLQLGADDLAELQLPPGREPAIGVDVLCGALVCTRDGADPTVNLLAPIVLNLQTMVGTQVIQPECGYSHRHPVFSREEMAPCS